MTGWRNREPKHVPLPTRASPNTGGSFTRAEIAVTSILLFITALGSSFSAFFTLPAKRRIALNLSHTYNRSFTRRKQQSRSAATVSKYFREHYSDIDTP